MSNLFAVSPVEGLARVLAAELANSSLGLTVIHAGHYSLTWNGSSASDNLDQASESMASLQEIAQFARSTWAIACEAVQNTSPQQSIRLMTLVNDWQLLQPPICSRAERDKRAAELRSIYYRNTPTLPTSHLATLAEYGIDTDAILRHDEQCWLFSESRLRKELNSTVKKLLKDPRMGDDYGLRQYFTETGEPVVQASGMDGKEYSLQYCGNTNCAGEVVQLLHHLQQCGVLSFINLYPAQCRQPVCVGTSLAQRIFGLTGMSVVNIAITPFYDGQARIVVDRL